MIAKLSLRIMIPREVAEPLMLLMLSLESIVFMML